MPTNLDKELHRLLGHELKDENLVKLSAAGEEFYCIWNHTSIGKALGAVVILHEEGQNVDWPLTSNRLRLDLADYGWSTLAVSLPNPLAEKISVRPMPTPPPPPTPNPEANDEEEDSEQDTSESKTNEANETNMLSEAPKEAAPASQSTPKVDIEAQVKARLEAAIDYLHGAGQFNIVIVGQGLGAARASIFINQLISSSAGKTMSTKGVKNKAVIQRPIRALIIINARNRISGSKTTLHEQLKDPGLPVLDITFGDHYLDKAEAKERRRWASRQQMKNYLQVKMRRPVGGAAEENNRLVKRVRGFLNRNAKGVEITK